jgi:hypothetical protein
MDAETLPQLITPEAGAYIHEGSLFTDNAAAKVGL